ncbi:nucleoside diphosphate kinase regulator [bacterium]|nr:nucleoside diphosphate kinase regulator [bacterium]
MIPNRDIYITQADFEKLSKLIETTGGHDRSSARSLRDELDLAIILSQEEIPPDVVTMNSRVIFQDEQTGQQRVVTLVYPRDSKPEEGKISVLAPIGTAILGLKVGESIDWSLPGQRSVTLRIMAVEYQPEAAGDYHL